MMTVKSRVKESVKSQLTKKNCDKKFNSKNKINDGIKSHMTKTQKNDIKITTKKIIYIKKLILTFCYCDLVCHNGLVFKFVYQIYGFLCHNIDF